MIRKEMKQEGRAGTFTKAACWPNMPGINMDH